MSINRLVSSCLVSVAVLSACQAEEVPDEGLATTVSAVSVPPQTFPVVADARVESGAPSSNHGTSPYLRAETTGATGAVWSYLKFDVSGLTGTVQSARLRVFISDGTDDGPKVYSASNSWTETGITWSNKPAVITMGEDPLKVPSGGYVEWDVTALVSGNGSFTFVFVPDSSDRMNGRSKEDPNPPQLTIHTGPSKQVFGVDADARVNSEFPTVEYGTADYLWVRPLDTTNGYPDVRTYLRFTVSGVTGPITNARVRLFNYDWASNGPRIYHVPDNTWGETTINWGNKPARSNTILDDKGPVPSGTYSEWDVSATVTGNGTYSFALEGDPTSHSMRAWAKEHGSLQSQLVVVVGGTAPPPPPTATGARWPISNSTAPDADTLGDAYGPRSNSGVHDFHAGTDIPMPIGTDVHAVLPGTVVSVVSTWDDVANPCCGGGRKVVIDHGGTPARYTTSLHLSQTLASVGATVAAGDVIGRVGISGAQHAHLHFTYSEGTSSEADSRNPLALLPHTPPRDPIVTFGSSLVSIVLPIQQMTVKTIKLEGGGQSRSVDYNAIVARGNPLRDEQVQGDGMYMECDNPTGSPLTVDLRVRPDPAGAFVPTRITIDSFDGVRWEFSAPATTSLSSVITAVQFSTMFPSAYAGWNYDSFIAAAASRPEFAAFGTTGDLTMRKREVAAFLANVAHETGFLTDLVENDAAPGDYCASRPYGCPSSYGYRGRGPLQLSWNYNYYTAGNFLGLPLLDYPVQVGNTPSVGWQTSLWFWMQEPGASSGTAHEMTAHAAMTSSAMPPGMVETIRVINGGLECDAPATSEQHEQRNARIAYYERFVGTEYLDVGTGTMNYFYCY